MRRSPYAGVIVVCLGAAILAVVVGHSKSRTNHGNTASAKVVTYPFRVTMETKKAFLAAEKAWRPLTEAEIMRVIREIGQCTVSGAGLKCPARITAAKH